MSYAKQAACLAALLNDSVTFTLCSDNRFVVGLAKSHMRYNHSDIMQRQFVGWGETIEEACLHALRGSAGKILYRRDGYFGKDENGKNIEKTITYTFLEKP